jgi:hypothetical protein
MKYLFIILVILNFSCGKTNQTFGTDSNNLSNLMEGTLSIPKPGVIGGGVNLAYANVNYQMSNDSAQVSKTYVDSLYYNQVNIAPITQTNTSKTYRVRFSGNFLQGSCPLNPSSNCPLVRFETLSAY